MALLNSDRLSHWFVGAVLGWAASLLLIYIPIFHWGLGFPNAKIAVSVGIFVPDNWQSRRGCSVLGRQLRIRLATVPGELSR
jgi:hypothetical protein